jgi:hypothetical protein
LLARAAAIPPGGSFSRSWILQNNAGAGLIRLWRESRRFLVTAFVAALLIVIVLFSIHLWRTHRVHGSLRLEVQFPQNPVHRVEPLLTLGRTGAADSFYVIYEDDQHVRIGLDHWAYGGPVSELIAVNFAQPQIIEISFGSLSPAPIWRSRRTPGIGPLRVTLNGRPVLTAPNAPFYPAMPSEVVVGHNLVGSSVATEHFSGKILKQERFIPVQP